MIENIKRISNPLTIIAIFAGLAEIAGTVAIKLVDVQYQGIFIWFVMIFPILLVLLFFIVLFLKPHNLYAPADFRSDESYIDINKKWTELLQSGNILKQPLKRSLKGSKEKQTKEIDYISPEGKNILLALNNRPLTAIEQMEETKKVIFKDKRVSRLNIGLNETERQIFSAGYLIGFVNNIQVYGIINEKESEDKTILTIPAEITQQLQREKDDKHF